MRKANIEAEAISKILNKELEEDSREFEKLIMQRISGARFRYAIECSRIGEELGWRSLRGFEDGLQLTMEWYLENQELG